MRNILLITISSAIILAVFTGVMVLCNETVRSDDAPFGRTDISPEMLTAIDKGLDWLAKAQNPNGSWNCVVGYKLNEDYITDTASAEHVCITALACMAFMANGSTAEAGKYSENISKGLDFVLSCVRPNGYITKNGTRMYEHAFATLFLSQAAGMKKSQEVQEKLKLACDLIVRSQNPDGGWRYQPQPIDADISVTVSTLQALRAARNVGVMVPKETIDKAMKYIKNSVNPDGSFNYQAGGQFMTRTSFALTSCGIVSLYSAGEYNSPLISRGLEFLRNNTRYRLIWGNYHYFYGHYYGAQAMYQAGGKYWEEYFISTNGRGVRDEIIGQQMNDGRWADDVGPTYATAMACLVLQVPFEYLPIFQK
ncbi:MAG: terpene cyclase/mutase family protein [Planctomycetes bacterium]|nr:terpene cyclase/mutase family protein [Planctomycetota bacterium]